jgi:hypothetical protein
MWHVTRGRAVRTGVWWGELEEESEFGTPRCRSADNIEIYFE